jgi:hypothetical protein
MSKSLKPPFYRGTAECPNCGTVEYERKPHRLAGQHTDGGGLITPHPTGIVCVCRYHARVTSFELVKKTA